MAGGKKIWLWVLVAVAGSCLLCTMAGLGLGVLGALAGDGEGGAGPSAASAASAQPGAAGGFAFDSPEGWTAPAPGRVSTQVKDGAAILTVQVIHLAAIPGLEDPEAKLARFWAERIGADWDGVSAAPMVMRRFVANGARAHFTSAPLRPKGGGTVTRVSVYLVEAGDRLEPLVVLQQYEDPTMNIAVAKDQMAPFSWDTTYPLVEKALAGVRGSPVGLPLVSDEEVVGQWTYSTGSHLQWVNTLTGATGMNTVSFSIQFAMSDDHRFTYKFQGASGQVGALQFSGESDEGEWKVEHDQLFVTGEQRSRKFLVVGAARTPEGKRSLFLLQHPNYSLSPGAVARHGELYVEK